MTTRTNDPWIAYRKPRPNARIRLFCFPYAGGGALIYRPWVSELPPEIDVVPVQLPGREQRLREKPFTRAGALVEAMTDALRRHFEPPFAFFGHSMGALLSYEVAQRLRQLGAPGPLHLLVSARRAPQLPMDDEEHYHLLPEPEFRDKLREINGTPEAVLENEELMELLAPIIRADFELNETYDPSQKAPLDVPISAFGGLEDEEVEKENLEAWREATTGPFKLRMFPGDHFFLHQEAKGALQAAVAETLLKRLS
jgi:surfactin synthase thioesterase subunit